MTVEVDHDSFQNKSQVLLIKNKSIQNPNILLVLTSKLQEYNKYSQNNNKLACFVSEDIDQTVGVL